MSPVYLGLLLLPLLPSLVYRCFTQAITLTSLFWILSGIFLGSFGQFFAPQFHDSLIILFSVLTLAVNIYQGRKFGSSPRRHVILKTLVFTGIFSLVVALSKVDSKFFLQVLGLGFDNAALLSIFSTFSQCGSFLYECNKILATTSVPNDFLSYPQASVGSWYLLMSKPFYFAADAAVIVYGISVLLTCLAIMFLVGIHLWQGVSGNRRLKQICVSFGLITSLLLGPWSHIIWSGFPSFLWAIYIQLAFIAFMKFIQIRDTLFRASISLLYLTSTILSYQLFLPVTLVLIGGYLYRYSFIWSKMSALVFLLVSMVCGSQIYSFLNVEQPKQLGLFERVLADGGISALPITVISLALVLPFFKVFSRGLFDNPIRLVAMAAAIQSSLLIVYSLISKGYISYYPMKFMYFTLLMSCIHAAQLLISSPRRTNKFSQFIAISMITLPLLTEAFSLKHASEFMGGSMKILTRYSGGIVNVHHPVCGPLIMNAVRERESPDSIDIVIREDAVIDIAGRWMGVLRNDWNEADLMYEKLIMDSRGVDDFTKVLKEYRFSSYEKIITFQGSIPSYAKDLEEINNVTVVSTGECG